MLIKYNLLYVKSELVFATRAKALSHALFSTQRYYLSG